LSRGLGAGGGQLPLHRLLRQPEELIDGLRRVSRRPVKDNNPIVELCCSNTYGILF